jgi:tyrosyl-DNA phosphodiesterase 2
LSNVNPQSTNFGPSWQAGGEGYFVAALLKTTSASYEDHCIEPYGQSRMGRNLLMVKARVKGVSMFLMTSHLESMKNHATERQRQLKICFDNMKSPPDANR